MIKAILMLIVFLLTEGVLTIVSLARGKGSVLGITLTSACFTAALWAALEKAGF